jgi:hypothetical protein
MHCGRQPQCFPHHRRINRLWYNERMPDLRPRKPRFRRATSPLAIRLTERDYQILDAVSVHRFLRSSHVTALVDGSPQHLIRRLGRLYHAGLLERPLVQRLHASEDQHISYCLSKRGRKELISRGKRVFPGVPRMRRLSSGTHLGHDLRVADIVTAIQTSARVHGIGFGHHHDWEAFAPDTGDKILHPLKWKVRLRTHSRSTTTWVIPDAAISIGDADDREVFLLLEVDRGTMPVARRDSFQSSILKKVEAYRETRAAGHLWKRWQIPGFRVLIVAETQERKKSLQMATARCFRSGSSTMFLFAVASAVLTATDPLHEAWEDCAGRMVKLVPNSPTEPTPCQSLRSQSA